MGINNNVSFGMVLLCKCVRKFGKVWAFARAEFGMGGTGICPSPTICGGPPDQFLDIRTIWGALRSVFLHILYGGP